MKDTKKNRAKERAAAHRFERMIANAEKLWSSIDLNRDYKLLEDYDRQDFLGHLDDARADAASLINQLRNCYDYVANSVEQ